MRDYLRRWPVLLIVLPGVFIGMLAAAGCLRTRSGCELSSTPADHLLGAAIGGAVALLLALLVIVAWVGAERRAAALAARFPGALLITGRTDWLTMQGAEQLGLALPGGSYFVVAVSGSGIQLWQGDQASRLLLGVPWDRVRSSAIGQPHGDPTAMQSTRMARAYERLAIGIVQDGTVVQLQFGVAGSAPMTRGSVYGDAYDLRALTRQINGYKAVHDRGAPE